MTPVCNSVRYLHGFTNERNSQGRNSGPCSFVIPCGNLFAANYSSRGANFFAVANCFAIFQKIFDELVRQNLRSPRTTVAANDRQISSRERIFWRTVRQFAAEYGRTRANSGERSAYSGERSPQSELNPIYCRYPAP